MGRNPWEDADPDLAAMGVRRSRFSWGRLFVGLLLVGGATVIGAYYLPLYRAHQALASDHQRVVDKAQGLERQAVELRGQLSTTQTKLTSLEAERQRAAAPAPGTGDATASRLKSELLLQLEKHTKKGAVAVGAESGRVVVSIADSALFQPRKLDVSAQGKAILCGVAKASGSYPLRVSALDANATPAPPLSQKYPTAWSLRSARASSAAQLLETDCAVPAARLSAQGVGADRASAAFASEKLPSTRIEIEITTRAAGG